MLLLLLAAAAAVAGCTGRRTNEIRHDPPTQPGADRSKTSPISAVTFVVESCVRHEYPPAPGHTSVANSDGYVLPPSMLRRKVSSDRFSLPELGLENSTVLADMVALLPVPAPSPSPAPSPAPAPFCAVGDAARMRLRRAEERRRRRRRRRDNRQCHL